MPELLVMRHAKSDWSTSLPDFARPLSPRGHDDGPRMAQWLADRDLEPDVVLSSAAARARSTAQYVIDLFELTDAAVDIRHELYHAGTSTWIDVMQNLPGPAPERLLACGHNPGLDDLVEYLAGKTPELTANGKLMTTGAIAVFSVDNWSSLLPTTTRLVELMRPRELR